MIEQVKRRRDGKTPMREKMTGIEMMEQEERWTERQKDRDRQRV